MLLTMPHRHSHSKLTTSLPKVLPACTSLKAEMIWSKGLTESIIWSIWCLATKSAIAKGILRGSPVDLRSGLAWPSTPGLHRRKFEPPHDVFYLRLDTFVPIGLLLLVCAKALPQTPGSTAKRLNSCLKRYFSRLAPQPFILQ